MFTFRQGVLFVGDRRIMRARWVSDYAVLVGLVGVVFHPTLASLTGSHWSAVWVIVCLMLQLPALARIVVVPFASIALASAMCVLVTRSPSSALFGISAYAIFFMLTYRTSRFHATFLTLAGIASLVALLQFLFTWDFLNFHATAQSKDGFLNQYRPTSIFPTQAYFNQMLLALVPLFWLAKERRPWVWLIAGSAAAVTGSTAGVVTVVLALFLPKIKGYLALVGFAATAIWIAICYPERLVYNFSLDDFMLSFGSRLTATGGLVHSPLATDLPPTSLPGHPTLMIAIEVLALIGLILIPIVAVGARLRVAQLPAFALGFAAIVSGQMIHSILGSLYFSIFLATLVALAWQLARMDPQVALIRARSPRPYRPSRDHGGEHA